MEPPAIRPRFFRRRWFTWRTARKLLFLLAALITLAALLLAEEDFRGGRAWENYKHAMEAKGEHFDIARLIPPKVPDDENFAMTPLLAPIFSKPADDPGQPLRLVTNAEFETESYAATNRGTNIALPLFDLTVKREPRPLGWNYGMAADLTAWAAVIQGSNSSVSPVQAASIILDKMKASKPELAELQSAAARRYCRFNLAYEDWDKPEVTAMMSAHCVMVKWLFNLLNLHAKAELVSGHADLALKDLNVMFRLDDGLKDEPLLMSQFVRVACDSILLQSVGEGLAEHRWSDMQLQILQERLQKTDLLASAILAFFGERDICFNLKFDQGYMWPRGWDRLEQLNFNRAFNQTVLPRIDLRGRKINPGVSRSMDLAFQQFIGEAGVSAILHHNIMARMTLPIIPHTVQRFAFTQSEVDMAMLACALERCRLAQGQYPDELNAMVPRFVAVLPHDIINGQPLKYRRTDNGERFILYSVGWNEKDDGGVVAATPGMTPRQDIQQGDWVWQYPEKN